MIDVPPSWSSTTTAAANPPDRLADLVAAASDRERDRQLAASRARLQRLAAQRQEAITLHQDRLVRCLTPEQLALLSLTWPGPEHVSGTQIPALLYWRGHTLRLFASHTGLHIEDHRPGSHGCVEGRYLEQDLWEGLLRYLGRLPGLHGCGHVVQRGDALADQCPFCTGTDIPF